MEALIQMFGGAATLIAVLGGAMATIFFAWAGIQWMTAAGDPQKVGQARMALIGAAIGLVIVGAAFIVPDVIYERVIAPAGGAGLRNSAGLSCDRVLKNQFVFQRAASTGRRMNAVIKQIQAQRRECSADLWTPKVAEVVADADNGCLGASQIGDLDVPRELEAAGASVRKVSGRDSNNNVIVHFVHAFAPTDSAICWLYSNRLKTWDQDY